MTSGEYGAGLLLLCACLGATGYGAWRLRNRLLPAWSGAPARLAELLIGLAVWLLVGQVLVAAGLLEKVPLALALVAAGALAAALGRPRFTQVPGTSVKSTAYPGSLLWLALAGGVLTFAPWIRRTFMSFDVGMGGVDTLWYHGPFAARMAQDGGGLDLHYTDVEYLNAVYPQNSELLHSMGTVLFEHDIASPAMNLLWVGLVLLAAWCIGRPRDLAPVSLLGACVVLCVPTLIASQAGEAKNDVLALALLAVAAALYVDRRRDPAALALAALACGLALGTKLTMAVPAVVLLVGIAIAARRSAWAVGIAAVVGGGLWYLRNLVEVGNPLPWVDLGPLPQPELALDENDFTVGHYLFDGTIWSDWLLPGLNDAFGPVWFVLIAGAALGVGWAIVRGATPERVLAAAALLTGLVYLFTPYTAAGHEDEPVGFVLNLRYAAPALLLGFVLLSPQGARTRLGVGAALLATIAVTQFGDAVWEKDYVAYGIAGALLVGVVVLLAYRHVAGGGDRRLLAAGLAACALLIAGIGWNRGDMYVDHAYTEIARPHTTWANFGLKSVYEWARPLEGERIAVVGTIGAFFQYPLYGRDLSNHVQFIGREDDDGSFDHYGSCREFRQALADGDYDYVVATADADIWDLDDQRRARETVWTLSDPATRRISIGSTQAYVYEVVDTPDPETC